MKKKLITILKYSPYAIILLIGLSLIIYTTKFITVETNKPESVDASKKVVSEDVEEVIEEDEIVEEYIETADNIDTTTSTQTSSSSSTTPKQNTSSATNNQTSSNNAPTANTPAQNNTPASTTPINNNAQINSQIATKENQIVEQQGFINGYNITLNQHKTDLANAEAALTKAQNNKTIRVYQEGVGFVYVADQSAIDKAQSNVSFYQRMVNDYNNLITTANNRISTLRSEISTLKSQLQ